MNYSRTAQRTWDNRFDKAAPVPPVSVAVLQPEPLGTIFTVTDLLWLASWRIRL